MSDANVADRLSSNCRLTEDAEVNDAYAKMLIEAMKAHTDAMLELAQAIREHAYLTAPEEDEDEPASTYMDGTPVQ